MTHDDYILMVLNSIDANYLITGSYLTNPDTANDIDVVLVYDEILHTVLSAKGFVRTNKADYKKGGGAATIRSTWRFNNYNVIVVHNREALALWRAFSNIISNDPAFFTNKETRIKLHETITKGYKET